MKGALEMMVLRRAFQHSTTIGRQSFNTTTTTYSLSRTSPWSRTPVDYHRYSSRALDPTSSIDQHETTHADRPAVADKKKSSLVTFKTLKELYRKEIPITMLTAYDFATARMVGMATSPSESEEKGPSSELPGGIDICLAGDSLANVCLGYQSTTELGVDEFVYHLQAIRRGLDSLKTEPNYRIPLFIADLPFGTYEASVEQGIRTATRLVQAARVDGLKIEGGKELGPLIERLTGFGIPVIGHIGLTPQRASSLGGFKVQGHDCPSKAREIIADALHLERVGCVGIVIEAVPVELISHLKKLLKVPLIGIGAGPETDGQVLVTSDLIGSLASHSPQLKNIKPKFVPNFSSSVRLDKHSLNPVFDVSLQIIRSYIHLVRTRQFPKIGSHTYSMKSDVLQTLNQRGWSS
ncbi:hypothetical protein PTTG_08500 [Puccinia triticina 1-1 BBBD Race 1]|uniref:3-methyl-2-oxobutanoate hydroxymethyltransferase n=2 Tax=Puccinia triticina TaxID=208348 RepID=A0A180GWE7_PUCT1|nr:uncharacterized protein PtA15_12A468 [Puccinia triticina]OAV96689.1 hypothetical protein PTTG_08500 [Puccinia triticina 1-1 BBBD Race 1]WAQ90478.1 hypothetical protein PtA15_12A468 [Puccinia triticina]WAR61796.1 hypothetical protein PtB15_12B487 [Puccinia triticina]